MNICMFYKIFVIIFAYCRIINGERGGTVNFIKMDNVYIDHDYYSVSTTSPMGCCAVCSEDDRCISASFETQTNVCQLNERNPVDFPDVNSASNFGWISFCIDPAPCPTEWHLYNRHCYLVVGTDMTWSNAQSNCQTLGGHLVEMDDSAENRYVLNLFGTVIGPVSGFHLYWLGINDMAMNGSFVLTSGDPVAYQNFDTGEPSNHVGEDCVASHDNGKWNDAPCSDAIRSVCEKFHY